MDREEPHTFRAAAKVVLILAGWVAGSVAALALIAVGAFWLLAPDFDFDLDLASVFGHPHFSPKGLEAEEVVWEFLTVEMLTSWPEEVFVIPHGDSTEAAADRLMEFCGEIWKRTPSSASTLRPFFVKWLNQTAAARAAYEHEYGAAEDARCAKPEVNARRWTDATPGARYRYEMARVQLDFFLSMQDLPDTLPRWEKTDPEEDEGVITDDGRIVDRMQTRFLFEWK